MLNPAKALLLFETVGTPAPADGGDDPLLAVEVEDWWVAQAVVTKVGRTREGVGSFEFGCPLWITAAGQELSNPVLDHFFESRAERSKVKVWRDGQKIAWGRIVDFDKDDKTGWCRFTCRDMTDDANFTSHGTGRSTGWVTKPGGGNDDPIVSSAWVGVNAEVGSSTSPMGAAGTVSYGDEKNNPWSFMYQPFTVPNNQTLHLEFMLNISPLADPPYVACVARFLNGKKDVTIPVSFGPQPRGRFGDPKKDKLTLSIPGMGAGRGSLLVEFAVFAPVDIKGASGGVNACSLAYRFTTDDDPEDPIQIHNGGLATDFVAQCWAAAFYQSGTSVVVNNLSGGLAFEDGMKIADEDTGSWASHISSFASTTESIWDAERVTVGPIGSVGQTWFDLRGSTGPNSLNPITGLTGGSRGLARYLNASASDIDGATIAYTRDIGYGVGDRQINVPANLSRRDSEAFAGYEAAKVSQPGRPTTMIVSRPQNGRTPGDWLRAGLNVGDRVPVYVPEPGFYEDTTLRITEFTYEPTKGDRLTLRLEPAL